MEFLSLLQIKQIGKSSPDQVPGRRIQMRDEDFFNFWMLTHDTRISRLQKVLAEDLSPQGRLDLGLVMFSNYPEIVEHNYN